MQRWLFLLVIIFLSGCGGSAAPTAVPTNTPTGGPKLVTPPSAQQYSGGVERIDFYVGGIKSIDVGGKVKRQDFYLVTESIAEIDQFYREQYKSDSIEGMVPQAGETTLTMFISTFGSGVRYRILISYIGLGTIDRQDGLLAVTVIQ